MMARKTLLTEGEIRQFMKLANLAPIGQGKLQEMGYDVPGARDEEDELDHVEDEEDATAHELGDMDADVHDKDDEIDDLEADLGAADDELAVDGGGAETAEELVVDLLALVQDWAAEQGVDMDVDSGAGEEVAMDDEVVVDDEIAIDEPEGGVELDMGVEDEMALEEEAPQTMDNEELVAEVARRVAARLAQENSQQEMVDELTERIFKRLTNS
tara:strand:+ start:2968 stop:3609 length:642 start_codon:yes stop_codon:yes gene_type:complete